MPESEYIYNATDDALSEWALNFTNRMGDGNGDHEIAYLDILKLLIELKRNGSLMDIGCGLGRVTEIARGRITRIVALEPDNARYLDCKKRFHAPPHCQILNQMSSDYIAKNPDSQFDLVVLGMVIQHVSTASCSQLIRDAAQLVKPNGVVIIATSLAPEPLKGFSRSSEPDKPFLNKEEFDEYANNPHTQDRGIPFRRFSKNELAIEVSPYFDIIQWTQFSYYRPDRIEWFCQMLQTDADTLKNVGNSQFMVLQKPFESN